MSNPHYKRIRHSADRTVVQINPTQFKFNLLFSEEQSLQTVVAFNTNYVEGNAPIGLFRKGGWKRANEIPSGRTRPLLTLGNCICEIGPLLVRNGTNIVTSGISEGKFRSDTVRQTSQVAIGITIADKLIVAYYKNIDGYKLADEMISLGCLWAVKADGGKSAYLRVDDIVRGSTLQCGVEVIPK